jgi:hypothetical protein
LVCLGCFVPFAGHILVVVGGDIQLFPFAGMFPLSAICRRVLQLVEKLEGTKPLEIVVTKPTD